MCQSIVSYYQFCDCEGGNFEQRCRHPTSYCEGLLANPEIIKMECYCPRHSSKTFKSERSSMRENDRISREYQRIANRESQQALTKDAAEERRRRRDIEHQIEAAKYQEYVEKNRRLKEEYQQRKADKKAGRAIGIREKTDGICCVM